MPGGRPTKINQVVAVRPIDPNEPDGPTEQVTVADRIVSLVAEGNYFETACAAVGIDPSTGRGWLRIGAQVLARIGDLPIEDATGLSEMERLASEFSLAIVEAEGRYEAGANLDLQRLARGGIEQTVTTVKTEAGGDETTTVRTSHTLPDGELILKRLARRFPDRYSSRLELTGRAGGPVELTADERANAVLQIIEQIKAQRAEEKRGRRRSRKKPPAQPEGDTPA